MNLKNIELCLENCDSIIIDGKHVGLFSMDDIRRSITRVAINSIEEMNVAQETFIEISKDACVPFEHGFSENSTNFQRIIECPDICYVIVTLEDNKGNECSHTVFTKWKEKDKDDFINWNQKASLTAHGHLMIYIGEHSGQQVFSMFEDKLISV